MSRTWPRLPCALLGALLLPAAAPPVRAAAPPAALRQETWETVALRVTAADAGGVLVVDRGRIDGLLPGDAVLFRPRSGVERRGTVLDVEERSARVALVDPDAEVPPGTRGEARVPRARVAPDEPPPPLPPPAPEAGAAPAPIEPTTEPSTGAAEDAPAPADVAPAATAAVELSVTVQSSGPGRQVTLDKGAADGLAVGDRVRFAGGAAEGRVARLGNRSAIVDLETDALPPVGARATVIVPGERLAPPAAAEEEAPPPRRWQTDDSGFEAGMPLLADVRAVQPSDRERQISGFGYLSVDQRFSSEENQDSALYRVGASVRMTNMFGQGGELFVDGEVNYRSYDLPGGDGESEFRLRLDRASYTGGGTRFSRTRWELGRFLQRGVPEFGVLDGFEWGYRRKNGDRWGASIGYMPVPDEDFESFTDLQVAAYYEWVANPREELTLTAGYQKTLHDAEFDRDLVLTKLRWQPQRSGWSVLGTAWVDLYTADDVAKGSGAELTQAWLTTAHEWRNGNSLEVFYRHYARPELLREEYVPVTPQELADSRVDRLGTRGWLKTGARTRLRAELGAWVDEEESGGDFELGWQREDTFFDDGRLDLSVFGARGEFSSTLGGRASLSRAVGAGYWSLFYELSNQHQFGFSDDRDDILAQRLRASRDFAIRGDWRLSVSGEGFYFDEQFALALGLYLQRSF